MNNREIFYDVYKHIDFIADSMGDMLEACMKKDTIEINTHLGFIKRCITYLENKYITPLSDDIAFINNINRNEMTELEERDYNYLIGAYKHIKQMKIENIGSVRPDPTFKPSFWEKLGYKKAIKSYKNIAKFSEAQMKRLEA